MWSRETTLELSLLSVDNAFENCSAFILSAWSTQIPFRMSHSKQVPFCRNLSFTLLDGLDEFTLVWMSLLNPHITITNHCINKRLKFTGYYAVEMLFQPPKLSLTWMRTTTCKFFSDAVYDTEIIIIYANSASPTSAINSNAIPSNLCEGIGARSHHVHPTHSGNKRL